MKSGPTYFVTPTLQNKDGNTWLVISIGEMVSAVRRGVWRSGWDMPEQCVAIQIGLEPEEGFGL